MNEQQKQGYINWFADGFDVYVADGRTLGDAPVEGNDMLSRFVRDVIDRNPNLGGSDPKYREVFKDKLRPRCRTRENDAGPVHEGQCR